MYRCRIVPCGATAAREIEHRRWTNRDQARKNAADTQLFFGHKASPQHDDVTGTLLKAA